MSAHATRHHPDSPRRPLPDHAARAIALLALALLLPLAGCEEPKPPPAAAAPAEPQKSRAQLMAEARAKMEVVREENRNKMRAVGRGEVTRLKRSQDRLEVTFSFTNEGDKPLAQAEGAVAFFDGSDNLIKQIAIPFRRPIAPGKTVTKKGRFPIDKADDGDMALAKAKLAELNQRWMPKKYRFEDGTTMESD